MITFLFWNICKNPIQNLIAKLVDNHDVDILILAELGPALHDEFLDTVNGLLTSDKKLTPVDGINNRLHIYTRNGCPIRSIKDWHGVSLHHVALSTPQDVLLAAVHLPSKMHKRDEDQFTYATKVAQLIHEAEINIGHSRTILMGDLNMNPFDSGVINAGALHAVMDHRIALAKKRKIHAIDYKYFYNPMWNYFGDMGDVPPGTYYYRGSYSTLFWY